MRTDDEMRPKKRRASCNTRGRFFTAQVLHNTCKFCSTQRDSILRKSIWLASRKFTPIAQKRVKLNALCKALNGKKSSCASSVLTAFSLSLSCEKIAWALQNNTVYNVHCVFDVYMYSLQVKMHTEAVGRAAQAGRAHKRKYETIFSSKLNGCVCNLSFYYIIHVQQTVQKIYSTKNVYAHGQCFFLFNSKKGCYHIRAEFSRRERSYRLSMQTMYSAT